MQFHNTRTGDGWPRRFTPYVRVGVDPGPEGTLWLPALETPFYLVLRAYLGHRDVVEGDWEPCPVERAQDRAAVVRRATVDP